jgi:hypothetical protein
MPVVHPSLLSLLFLLSLIALIYAQRGSSF